VSGYSITWSARARLREQVTFTSIGALGWLVWTSL